MQVTHPPLKYDHPYPGTVIERQLTIDEVRRSVCRKSVSSKPRKTTTVASAGSQNCLARDEAPPAHDAAPLWQVALAEAAAHV